MKDKDTISNEFRLVLQGLELTPATVSHMETELNAVLLRELAGLDFQGDLSIIPKNKFPSIFAGTAIDRGTSGIVARTSGTIAKKILSVLKD